MARKMVQGVSSSAHLPHMKQPGLQMPAELLDKAVARLCFVSLVSAVSTVTFFLIHGFLQEEAAMVQKHPLLGATTAGTLLLSLAYYGLNRVGWVTKQTILHLGVVFQVLMSLTIGIRETSLLSGPQLPVIGISAVALWIAFCGLAIPNTPLANLVGSLLSLLSWPVAYFISLQTLGYEFIGWNRVAVWLFPIALSVVVTNMLSRNMYSMQLKSQRAEELGSYTLDHRIGQGGMGEVWLARHRMLAREAAIKLIRPEILSGETMQGESLVRKRFEREAQATAALRNPHTVSLFDFGVTKDGLFYYVMELLEGIDLQSLVERFGPLEPGRVRNIMIQVCESLEEAHSLSLVHRDIKPRNIFLSRMGYQHDFVKVLDFGLVKSVAPGEATLMTQNGAATGTPAYMAPEIALGNPDIDGRADLYALGCVGYFLLTGQLVFTETNPTAAALAHVTQQPIPPSERTELPVPSGLEQLILECLAKDPQDRPATARDLARRLEQLNDIPNFCRDRAAAWWATNLPEMSRPAARLRTDTQKVLESARA